VSHELNEDIMNPAGEDPGYTLFRGPPKPITSRGCRLLQDRLRRNSTERTVAVFWFVGNGSFKLSKDTNLPKSKYDYSQELQSNGGKTNG
jgi:hypothetical protein